MKKHIDLRFYIKVIGLLVIYISTLYCDRFGDTVTSIGSFRYGGNFFSYDAIYDAGTYGDVTYFLYGWDETHRRYKEVCSCR